MFSHIDLIDIVGGSEIIQGPGGENDVSLLFLNDLHVMETQTYTYMKPFVLGTPPSPRQGTLPLPTSFSHECLCVYLLGHTATLVGRKIWFIGGADSAGMYLDVYTFDVETYEWAQPSVTGPAKLPGRYNHTAVLIGKEIWIYGGFTGYLNTTQHTTQHHTTQQNTTKHSASHCFSIIQSNE